MILRCLFPWVNIVEKKKKESAKSCLTLMILQTVACQAPLSMGFSRQEYWSGLPFPFQGIFPTQDLNPGLPHCRQMLYRLNYGGSTVNVRISLKFIPRVTFCVDEAQIHLSRDRCYSVAFLCCFPAAMYFFTSWMLNFDGH